MSEENKQELEKYPRKTRKKTFVEQQKYHNKFFFI